MCGKPHQKGFHTVLHSDRVCRAISGLQRQPIHPGWCRGECGGGQHLIVRSSPPERRRHIAGGIGQQARPDGAPNARPQRQRSFADAQMRIACAESARSLDRKVKIAVSLVPYDDLAARRADRKRGSKAWIASPSATRSMSSVVDSVGWNPSSQVSPLWSRLLARSVTRNASAAASPATGLSN